MADARTPGDVDGAAAEMIAVGDSADAAVALGAAAHAGDAAQLRTDPRGLKQAGRNLPGRLAVADEVSARPSWTIGVTTFGPPTVRTPKSVDGVAAPAEPAATRNAKPAIDTHHAQEPPSPTSAVNTKYIGYPCGCDEVAPIKDSQANRSTTSASAATAAISKRRWHSAGSRS